MMIYLKAGAMLLAALAPIVADAAPSRWQAGSASQRYGRRVTTAQGSAPFGATAVAAADQAAINRLLANGLPKDKVYCSDTNVDVATRETSPYGANQTNVATGNIYVINQPGCIPQASSNGTRRDARP